MKNKIVGIFVCTLLIATALPAVGTMNDKEIPPVIGIYNNSLKNPNTPKSINRINPGVIFIQFPFLSEGAEKTPVSDKDFWGGILVFDNFEDVSEPICNIHWWGLAGEDLQTSGDPTGMKFNITFYDDDGNGKPGNIVCKYVDIAPTIVDTGIEYYEEAIDELWPLYYFTDVTLEPCCEMSEGWVSIQSQSFQEIGVIFGWGPSSDGNKKSWLYNITENQWWFLNWDLAYALTNGEPAEPDLECEGSLSWDKVKPGDNVTGSFKVSNNGDAGSILNWNISSYPDDWGTNWSFTPKASVLTTDMGWITIGVNFTAPKEKRKEFTGMIEVVNAVDPSDNCEIDVKLKTPKNKAFIFNFPLLSWLFERFPDAFPILRYMLGI